MTCNRIPCLECELACPYAECPYDGVSAEQFNASNCMDRDLTELCPEKKARTREYNRQYREHHRDEIREYNRQYRESHKEYYRNYQTEYMARYRDVKLLKDRTYYLNNKENILDKQKQYYSKNRERIRERHRVYWELHKDEINARRRERRRKKTINNIEQKQFNQ